MDDQGAQQREQGTAGTKAGGAVRELFDFNFMYEGDAPWWRQWLIRFALFGAGSLLGEFLWGIVVEDAGDRSFWERLLTNVYIWACLITTGLYALGDWRARRKKPRVS